MLREKRKSNPSFWITRGRRRRSPASTRLLNNAPPQSCHSTRRSSITPEDDHTRPQAMMNNLNETRRALPRVNVWPHEDEHHLYALRVSLRDTEVDPSSQRGQRSIIKLGGLFLRPRAASESQTKHKSTARPSARASADDEQRRTFCRVKNSFETRRLIDYYVFSVVTCQFVCCR